MNKILKTTTAGAFFLAVLSTAAIAEVSSLRGTNTLDAGAQQFEAKKAVTVDGGIDRNWELQPPSIPHDIEKDRINLQENTCMRCHSAANYEQEKSPKVGDSHFKDRDGNTLEKLSTRRYFCSQCHTLQMDASPLVENTFQGAM
ncbi:MAG: nitrate reductase cytochrome c-type subunit [Pseudomonadota bacterium]|nr:nitrate reductase cytochrome c-type subunit [Pseudomonadota bacterium]